MKSVKKSECHPERPYFAKNMCESCYLKQYYEMHRDRYREYDRANRLQRRAQTRANNQKRRQEIIAAMGGKCVRCGFDDWRALQIDHVNGGGWVEYKELKSRWKIGIKALEDTEGNYQLLCANCNWIKRYENGEHTGYLKVKEEKVA